MKLVVVLLLAALCFVSAFQYPCSKDKSTYTNCDEVISKNIFLNITVDFNNKRVSGYSEISATKIAPTNVFTLDTRHLKISAASLLLNGRETPLSFNLVDPEGRLPVFGTALNLQLPANTPQSFTVRVYFVATNESETIQFLEPQQTAGGVHPYLFTQSESIHSRSMFPCQDTPSVKATFNASVTVPQPLVVVMSGFKKAQFSQGDRTVYLFEQPIPIPSYLIAMGVGALVSGNIGPRSKVWTEKEFLDAATFEFADTEKFIAAAESFLIPYEWKVYDLLLLPPSFPFGGMENPQLTFVTPTLLAGDRSLANVIAHEISHSWSGNLVTNQNWEDFWLNEGFTVYSERRITGIVKGEPEAGLGALIGLNELKADIEAYNVTGQMELTQLIPNLDNVSPEDAFSSVPYEKGFNFLFYLSSLVGRENFDKFLEAYFTNFKYSTVNHNQMKNFFLSFFSTKVDPTILDGIEWDKWFYTTGMPYKANKFDTSLADAAVALAQLWVQSPSAASQHKEFLSWSSNQKSYFLDNLIEAADSIDVSTLDLLESVYALSTIKNAEIRFRWEMLCLKKSYSKIYQSVVQFVTSQGRMKFVRPLYRALFNAEGGKQLAVDTFIAHRGFYHPIAAKMIAQDLGIKKHLSFRA